MLLAVIQKHVHLRPASGHRQVGPCPKCGGSEETERFSVRTDKGFFHCYSCGWNGDLIKALRQLEGMSCPEAYAAAGRECDRASVCPVADKCSRGMGKRRRKNELGTPQASQTPARRGFTPSAANSPTDLWQQKVEILVEWAHKQLLGAPDQLAYLAARGLELMALERYRLGWIPVDIYRERASWGLPEELKADGKAKKLWMPRGIVIPAIVDGRVHRVRIRRPNDDLDADRESNPKKEPLRYYAIPGSGNDVIIQGAGLQAALVVESDLDAHLLHHLVGDVVSVISLTTCSAKPKESAANELKSVAVILVATDHDAAGDNAFKWWSETYPEQAVRWPVSDGKDPGEAFQRGVDLRAWVLAGLPISLHPKKPKTTPKVSTGVEAEIVAFMRNAKQQMGL